MPYEWVKQIKRAPDPSGALSHAAGASPAAELHVWPYRSLPQRGFVWFIAITATLIALPLVGLIGSPVLWGLLPFLLLALAGIWYALRRNYRDGKVIEDLCLWPDHLSLVRYNPRTPRQDWEANPYWVTLQIYPTDGPVPDYLTLKGSGREVELGAFLSPEERRDLHHELADALAALRRNPAIP